MATLKQRLHRKNASGTYDVIHMETSADLVKRADGTKNVESSLAEIESWNPIKYEENGTVAPYLTAIDADTLEGHPASDFATKGDVDAAGYKVGDTLATLRTDLGDKWLLCNGNAISVHDYSELAELFPSLAHSWSIKDVWSSSYDSNIIYCVTYANGYWVAGGLYTYNNTYYARIAYTTDPTGTWTTKDLWNGGGMCNITCITYANGYWVVCGKYYYNNAYYARIAYTTDLTGTWTTNNLWGGDTSSSDNNIYCITYANGYWVACGSYYYGSTFYAQIAYSTTLSGTWAKKSLWSGSSCYIKYITYANGYWVCVGNYHASSNYSARIAYTTNPNNDWSLKDLWSNSNSEITITFANDYWVIYGTRYHNSTYYVTIAYTKDITGTWTEKSLWRDTNYILAGGITYADGYWIIGLTYYDGSNYFTKIAYTIDITGEWTIQDLWSGKSSEIYCVIYANGYWIGSGIHYDGSIYSARIAYTDKDALLLPKISQNNIYTYIKAKE